MVWIAKRGRDRPRQAGEYPGVDHGFGEQEDVGRPTAGQRRDGVQLRLGQPDHLTDGAEQSLGTRQIVIGGIPDPRRWLTCPRRPASAYWA